MLLLPDRVSVPETLAVLEGLVVDVPLTDEVPVREDDWLPVCVLEEVTLLVERAVDVCLTLDVLDDVSFIVQEHVPDAEVVDVPVKESVLLLVLKNECDWREDLLPDAEEVDVLDSLELLVDVLVAVKLEVELPVAVPLRVPVLLPDSDILDVLVREVVVVSVLFAEDVPVLDCLELPVTVFVCKVEGEMEVEELGVWLPLEVLLMELVEVDDRVRGFPRLGELVEDVVFVGNEEAVEDALLLGLLVPFGQAVEVDDDDLETVVLDERLDVEEPDDDLELAALTDDTELAEDVLLADDEDVPLLVADDVLDIVDEVVDVRVEKGVQL